MSKDDKLAALEMLEMYEREFAEANDYRMAVILKIIRELLGD